MADSDRLQRIEMRQEAVIQAINGLTGVMEDNKAILLEMQAWLQEPPSSDLPDLLAQVAATLADLNAAIAQHGQQIEALPERLVAALRAAR